jgi:hypothetical protein
MCKAAVTQRAQLRKLAFKNSLNVFDQFPDLAQKYYIPEWQLKKVSKL